MPAHLKIDRADLGKLAIISGDPERIELLSTKLSNVELLNKNRGFLTYQGKYNGKSIILATHGIGATSASIVIEELIMLGIKKIIRLGTAGSLRKEFNIGDVIIPTSAAYGQSSPINVYTEGFNLAPAPDYFFIKQFNKFL